MHAVVATVKVDNPAQARERLQDLRLPVVRRAPGVVCGYWLEPVDGVGMSVIVFETEEHARAALAFPLAPIPGVTPLTLTVREVYASL